MKQEMVRNILRNIMYAKHALAYIPDEKSPEVKEAKQILHEIHVELVKHLEGESY